MGLFAGLAALGGSLLSSIGGSTAAGSAGGGLLSGLTSGSMGSWLSGAGGAALGSVLDSGLDFGMGQYSAHQVFKQQKELMKYQHDLNLDAYGQRHQLEVKDLRSAGLNPILSANSGGSVAGTGLNSALSLANEIGKVSESRRSGSQEMLNHALLQTQITQQKLNNAQVYGTNARAQADMTNADANMLRARADAAYAGARTRNEILYPSNQPMVFKYLNSGKGLFSDYIRNIPRGKYGGD